MPHAAEAEFRAYHLLSLMGQHGKFKGDQQAFLSMLQASGCTRGEMFAQHGLCALWLAVCNQAPSPPRALAWLRALLQAMRPDVRGSPAIQWVLKLQARRLVC